MWTQKPKPSLKRVIMFPQKGVDNMGLEEEEEAVEERFDLYAFPFVGEQH